MRHKHIQRTRTTRLHLRDILLPQAELLVDAQDILPNGQRGHAVRVVRNTAERLGALACGEGLPPGFCAAVAGVY